MPIYRLENISFKQVDELDRAKTIVILPCGSMEQHGPHLPNGMDTQVATKVAELVCQNADNKMDCLLLPPVPYGQSPEHMDFPGTISFSAETYITLLKEICGSVARHGFKKMYIINGHGGNISAIGAAAFDIRDQFNLTIFMFNVWAVISDIALKHTKREAPHQIDAHGGEIETSLMLHLTPKNVHMEWSVDEENPRLKQGKVINLGGPVSFNWNSLQDIAPSGISGMASFGTSEKGLVIFDALVDLATQGLLEIDANW
ncbi:MAG: creatininase family protein [Bellilinea sp.]